MLKPLSKNLTIGISGPDISSVEGRAAVSPSVGSVKLIPVEEPIIVDQVSLVNLFIS